jgi:hypothetical protein
VIETLGAIGSFLSGIGLFAAAAGLFYSVQQTRAAEKATSAAVYQSIVAMADSINDMFIERPELHPQLFGDAAISSTPNVVNEQAANPRRFFAALKWLDYFDVVLIHWKWVPEDLYEPWREYIKETLASSSYLQRIILETKWYSDDLRQMARHSNNPNVPPPNLHRRSGSLSRYWRS